MSSFLDFFYGHILQVTEKHFCIRTQKEMNSQILAKYQSVRHRLMLIYHIQGAFKKHGEVERAAL